MSVKFTLSSELSLYVNTAGRVSVYDQDGLAGIINTQQAHELATAIFAAIRKAQQELKARREQEQKAS